jgi:hypothetical protein
MTSAFLDSPLLGFSTKIKVSIVFRLVLMTFLFIFLLSFNEHKIYVWYHAAARNYKFLSIGDSNHTLMGVYGPGKNFALQPDFRYFRDPILNLSASPTNYGVIDYEGSTFNWFSRMVVFCGGKQVDLEHLANQITFPGVNFTNILCPAFTLIDTESIKNTVMSSVSFYAFGICVRKSCM